MNKCLFYFCAWKPGGNWWCQGPLLSHSQRPDRDGGSLSVTDGSRQAATPQAHSPRSQLWTLSGICSSFRAWQCFTIRHSLWSVTGGKLAGGAVIFITWLFPCLHFLQKTQFSAAACLASGRSEMPWPWNWHGVIYLHRSVSLLGNTLTPRCVSAAYVWCIGWTLVVFNYLDLNPSFPTYLERCFPFPVCKVWE